MSDDSEWGVLNESDGVELGPGLNLGLDLEVLRTEYLNIARLWKSG